MKFLRLCTTALVLLLGATIAHAQGFQEKSFPAGPPKPEVKYHMIVPEGVTITNKKGEVYTAGQTVLVPGANVTILEPAYVKEQMKDPTFKSGFVNEKSYSGMSEQKVRNYAIVSVQVPEGVTVQGPNGTIKGPSSVKLIAAKADMQATPNDTPTDAWSAAGGWVGRGNP
ncbi:MAG TPA: hypothetical protein P5260_08465 [Candidatus Competibacter sp.]|jgi:hypothetical protein|nr:hypothetical protein [Candidatus Competibacter sp.]HRF62815.1 hypothetical protein [Candidatus Competibacter sp.]HRX61236.1 hypothetical protein [Candidatus Competibacter sp.]